MVIIAKLIATITDDPVSPLGGNEANEGRNAAVPFAMVTGV